MTDLAFLFGELCVFGVGVSDLLDCLRSVGQSLDGRVQKGVDRGHLGTDRLPQGRQQGVKQPLDVVIYHRLHRHGRHSDTVDLDLTEILVGLVCWIYWSEKWSCSTCYFHHSYHESAA